MPIGDTLATMVAALRAATGRSQSTALGIQERDNLVALIQTRQRALYMEHGWLAKDINEDFSLTTGSRYYPFPPTIAYEFVHRVWARDGTGSIWLPVHLGITMHHINARNPDDGQTSWPVRNWRTYEGQIEVWPVPSRNGEMRVFGRAALSQLIQDSDPSTIDGDMIVAFCAAEMLARAKTGDADNKLKAANELLRMSKARQRADKARPFVLGGGVPPSRENINRVPFRVNYDDPYQVS